MAQAGLVAIHYCLQRREVILEEAEPMHAIIKDGTNAKNAIRKMAPINEKATMLEEKTIHVKRFYYCLQDNAMRFNLIKCRKQAGDLLGSLLLTPLITRVAINVI